MPIDPSIFTVGVRGNLPVEVRFPRMDRPEAGPYHAVQPPDNYKFTVSQVSKRARCFILQRALFLEQGTGVEPAFTAWEAVVLPIYEPCGM